MLGLPSRFVLVWAAVAFAPAVGVAAVLVATRGHVVGRYSARTARGVLVAWTAGVVCLLAGPALAGALLLTSFSLSLPGRPTAPLLAVGTFLGGVSLFVVGAGLLLAERAASDRLR